MGLFFFLLVENFIFISNIASVASLYNSAGGVPFNLTPLTIFGIFFDNIYNPQFSILSYLFWMGLVLLLFHVVLSFDLLRKEESFESRADLFNLIVVIFVLCFFLFFTRLPEGNIGDPRWYYPLLLSSIVCISKSTLFIADYIKKYSKYLSIIIIIVLIAFGGYYELKHADMIIRTKIPSFQGIKDAGLFLKENSNPEDIIITMSNSQTSYYAERKVIDPRMASPDNMNDSLDKLNQSITLETFLERLKKQKEIKYIIVTFSEPHHPAWMRQEEYFQNPSTGEVSYSKWIIPFMNTTIDFLNNQQDIKQEINYDGITFKLINISEDAFTYEIKKI